MKIGIVGLPNVGKSTLFNALTQAQVLAANYPFATIEPNVGIVPVADARLERLRQLYAEGERQPKLVPATVSFVDIAGLVRGASEGQGLGNQFLANIREAGVICQVVRAFADDNVTHVEGRVNPSEDIEIINTELILADLQAIDRRLGKVAKDPTQRALAAALQEARQVLDGGRTLFAAGIDPESLHELQLLTAKPFIYVFNVDEADLANDHRRQELAKLVTPAQSVMLCAKVEAELVGLEPAEAAELLAELGQPESGLQALVRLGQEALRLQTFLTAGPKEVRSWTIPRGATAPQAAGVIHTDFQKKFIKAEAVSYDDLIAAGSLTAARAAGRARMEGKDYVMRPDDVVEFHTSA
jgi:GTP-binding protein YchF